MLHSKIFVLVSICTTRFINAQQSMKNCTDEDEPQRPKLLGERCETAFDCFNRFAVSCVQNRCTCRPGTYPMGPYVCQPGPELGAPCVQGVCRSPYVCTQRNRCDCPLGMTRAVYNGSSTCECENGLLRIGSECLKVVRLGDGEECKSVYQCKAAFSYCRMGRCECKTGFSRQGQTCVADYSCQAGTPLRDGVNVMLCHYNKEYLSNQPADALNKTGKSDTCPLGHYCKYMDKDSRAGYCCPNPMVQCPMGNPLPLNGLMCATDVAQATCPSATHFCFNYNVDGFSGALCCPSICPPNFVEEQGQCYSLDPVLWTTSIQSGAMPCEVDKQCNYDGNHAQCVNQKCECEPGYGFGDHRSNKRWCIRQCASNQVWVGGNRCLTQLRLGQSCDRSEQCPANSYCKKSTGTCECRCDQRDNGFGRCERTIR